MFFSQEVACLSAVITNHSMLPHLWHRLGRAYVELSTVGGDGDVDYLRRRAAASFIRAKLLLKSVGRSVSGIALEKNKFAQNEVDKELEALNLPEEISKELFDIVTKKIKSENEADEAATASTSEFEDLGKSSRMKAIEESFQKLDANSEVDVKLISLPNSEPDKLFRFLNEIK